MSGESLRQHGRQGFTLIELLVAVVITSGIAGATVMALSQSLRARETSLARQQAMMRADVVASRIASDVSAAVRDGDLYFARVLITDRTVRRMDRDELLVFTTMNRRLRAGSLQNEGGEYEVHYRLVDNPREDNPSGSEFGVLWRRVDPVPDEVPDGGGVVMPIAERIASLSFEAFDGESWQRSWDSDRDGYPHAVRLSVGAVSDDGERSALVRRVVALDRVPLPFAAPVQVAGEGGRP